MAVTVPLRQDIIAAINGGSSSADIAARFGVTLGQVAAIRAHMTMGTYSGVSSATDTEEEVVANAVDTAFGLERDLQMALRKNIEQLEQGLTISDEGKEQTVPSGRIDITAQDRDGTTVVIELKVGAAGHEAVSQLLGYMGDLMNKGERVRGILVAGEFAARAVSAARPVPNLRLVQYGFRFNFETVAQPPPV